jgi:hypothetical protein
LDSNQFILFFHPNYQAETLFALVSPFAQSVEMPKIARQVRQAILMGGIGLEPTTPDSEFLIQVGIN